VGKKGTNDEQEKGHCNFIALNLFANVANFNLESSIHSPSKIERGMSEQLTTGHSSFT
jgi:hypothetical protein